MNKTAKIVFFVGLFLEMFIIGALPAYFWIPGNDEVLAYYRDNCNYSCQENLAKYLDWGFAILQILLTWVFGIYIGRRILFNRLGKAFAMFIIYLIIAIPFDLGYQTLMVLSSINSGYQAQ